MSITMLRLALFLLGFSMVRSAVCPRWLGRTGVVLVFAMVTAVGNPNFSNGYTSTLLIFFGGPQS